MAQFAAMSASNAPTSPAEHAPDDLVAHLVSMSRLRPAEAQRLALEVLAYFAERPEAFITRRHAELQAHGESNSRIYARLGEELAQRRFTAPAFSERQIRRIIYG